MPKAIRSPEEIETVKNDILTTALKLMCDDGFDALSMRKLATRLKMTAANIYNYYKNKDDLYLAIQTRGFQMIVDRFQEIYASDQPTREKLHDMMHAYLKFGVGYPDYYEIMFSRNTPKYADYKGTPMEPTAYVEKQTALKVSEITTRTIMELYDGSDAIDENEALYRTIIVWSTLHGVVNLFNSRVLQEVEEASEELIYRLINDLMKIAIKPKNEA
ncbi:MAG: TetR/AcrR family transcriptional regulator [Desulfobacteraceae bacterium]|nr:TetR/AcrR family transcriptional regulator [Desulfobacteraceae bacterium]MBC2757780.1 TetR/AcrR family transcriptional regulator [Desulfobacteraceae bacterium]MBC2763860.1 TetR/AcrR family transcriptional regulator [ANME-2 cluster archaeon]